MVIFKNINPYGVIAIIAIVITLKITLLFANNLYLSCYDDLQKEQRHQTLDSANEINNLDFNNPEAELKALQIQKRNDTWFENKIEECRGLTEKYAKYMIPIGIVVLIMSFYLTQLFYFSFIKAKSSHKSING